MRMGSEHFILKDFAFYDAMIMPVLGLRTIAVYEVLRRHIWRSLKRGSLRSKKAFREGRLCTTVSRRKVAHMTGMSIRGVQRALNKLRVLGWIQAKNGKGTGETLLAQLGYRDSNGSEVFYADGSLRELWIGLERLVEKEDLDSIHELTCEQRETYTRWYFRKVVEEFGSDENEYNGTHVDDIGEQIPINTDNNDTHIFDTKIPDNQEVGNMVPQTPPIEGVTSGARPLVTQGAQLTPQSSARGELINREQFFSKVEKSMEYDSLARSARSKHFGLSESSVQQNGENTFQVRVQGSGSNSLDLSSLKLKNERTKEKNTKNKKNIKNSKFDKKEEERLKIKEENTKNKNVKNNLKVLNQANVKNEKEIKRVVTIDSVGENLDNSVGAPCNTAKSDTNDMANFCSHTAKSVNFSDCDTGSVNVFACDDEITIDSVGDKTVNVDKLCEGGTSAAIVPVEEPLDDNAIDRTRDVVQDIDVSSAERSKRVLEAAELGARKADMQRDKNRERAADRLRRRLEAQRDQQLESGDVVPESAQEARRLSTRGKGRGVQKRAQSAVTGQTKRSREEQVAYADAHKLWDLYLELLKRIDPEAPVAAWSAKGNGKNRGQLTSLVKMYGAHATDLAIRYVIGNWQVVFGRYFKDKPMGVPSLGLLYSLHEPLFREASLWARNAEAVREYHIWYEKNPNRAVPSELRSKYTMACEVLSKLGFRGGR